MRSKPVYIAIALLAIAVFAGAAWFTYQQAMAPAGSSIPAKEPRPASGEQDAQSPRPENAMQVRIFQPSASGIAEAHRSVPVETHPARMIDTVVAEFLKQLPKSAQEPKLLGIYRDRGGTVYIDISGAIKPFAQGDAAREHLLLKALVLTVVSNVPDVQDVRILVDGKEAPTLGGHISLASSLRELTRDDPPRMTR